MIHRSWHHREPTYGRNGNCIGRHSWITRSSVETHSCNLDRCRSRTMTPMGHLRAVTQGVGNRTSAKTWNAWNNDDDLTRGRLGVRNILPTSASRRRAYSRDGTDSGDSNDESNGSMYDLWDDDSLVRHRRNRGRLWFENRRTA